MITAESPTTVAWDVPLEAGLWAVAGVVLLALILLTALRPALRTRRKDDPMACCEPGSLGRHPLGEPDGGGVRRCDCGTITSIPAGGRAIVGGVTVTVGDEHVGTPIEVVRRLQLVSRTDTREHHWPARALELARAVGHPSVREPDDVPTDAFPLPHLVWPPR